MTILDEIVSKKKEELIEKKLLIPKSQLLSLPYYEAKTVSLRDRLLKTRRKVGIIAEMKKASPSKGILIPNYNPEKLYHEYQIANVEGISILTDKTFFQGDLVHLMQVRQLANTIPLLRKDFIIDSYQITEAKGYGASVVLLIASILEAAQYQELYNQAKELEMEVLTEIHSKEDLEKVLKYLVPDIIGINNRDLRTFETSLTRTFELAKLIPKDVIIISESGIKSKKQIDDLGNLGISGVLVGEQIVQANNHTAAIIQLVGTA